MKSLWNTYKSSILLLGSMLVGGIVGAIWGPGAKVLQPIADIFLNLLYCCVVPLIFCSLTAAIAKMTDLTKLRKILVIFLIGTIVTGIIACLFMVVPCLLIDPAAGANIDMSQEVGELTSSMNFLGMFTVNDFPLLFSRGNLMALIVFTVIHCHHFVRRALRQNRPCDGNPDRGDRSGHRHCHEDRAARSWLLLCHPDW